ncbi:MAG: serine/threonine protein kinase [Deltaproteobacteria bacterium]|nr:serine/threonine protein kinase [Deltaproteobacteria bacterium]
MGIDTAHYCPKCDSEVHVGTAACPRCNLGRPHRGWPVDEKIDAVVSEKYRIQKRIGKGGMGSVYLAEQVYEGASLGKVAIKFLQPMGTASEQEFLKNKFVSEAGYARLFNSPHVIKVYDFGTYRGETYMAMEFLQGESLGDVLYRRGTLSVGSTLYVCLQIAEALAEIHRHAVVHRDIKPDNILLLDDEYVKLLDFGIAKRIDPGFQKTSTKVGTPSYMAPEQARGEEVDERTDIYALGILMYHCLVGEPPFFYENLEQIHSVSLPIVDIAEARPGLAEPLRGLVNAMIHPQAAKRPATSTEVVEALRALQPEGAKRKRRTTRPAGPTQIDVTDLEPPPVDLQPTQVAANPIEVAITGKDVMRPRAPRRPPPARFTPVVRRRTWGTGQVIAAVIVLLGLFALGDHVYMKYLDGLTWNEIVQGKFLPSKNEPPLPVDASTREAAWKDEPAIEEKPAKKKKRSVRPRKKKKPAQPPAGEP